MALNESCRVCGGGLAVRFNKVIDPESNEAFSLARCEACGLGHTLPVPTDLRPYYTKEYYGKRHGPSTAFCDRRRVRFVQSMVPKPGTLLDVGCGEGTFLLAAQRAGWTVAGNEMNPEPARSHGLKVSSTLEGGPYDCITLWHSLEHMLDPLNLLTTLGRMLTPDGALIAAVPDAGGLQARVFGASWFHLDVPRHVMHYDSHSLNLVFRKAGLLVERRWHQEWEYDLLGWVQSALNCVFRQRNVFFRLLTGRVQGAGAMFVALNAILGSMLILCACPLAWGGTLIFAARPEKSSVPQD